MFRLEALVQLDERRVSEQVQLMLSRGQTLAQTKQPVSESLSVVGQNTGSLDVRTPRRGSKLMKAK